MRRFPLLLLMATAVAACTVAEPRAPGPWPPPRYALEETPFPVHVTVAAEAGVSCPHAVANAVRDGSAPGLAVAAGSALASARGDEAAAVVGGAGVVVGLGMAGAGATIGAIVGGIEAEAYEAGAETLERQMEQIDLQRFVQSALCEHLGRYGPAGAGATGAGDPPPTSYLNLHLAPPRLCICMEPGTFCLELVARADLRPRDARWPVYDRTLVFTSREARGPAPAGDVVPRPAVVFAVDRLREPESDAMLRRELVRGVNGLCAQVARDMGRRRRWDGGARE